MTQPPVYLDYNASAPLRSVAKTAILEGLEALGNPSSVHSFGRAARQKLEAARLSLKRSINAGDGTLILTSGGTEANNLALGAFESHKVFVCPTSHVSALLAREDAYFLGVHPSGCLDLEALDKSLSDARKQTSQLLVSVILANNETGVIQPLEDIIKVAKSHGALVHGDGAQVLGRLSFDFWASGLDLFSFSSHKVGGPVGVGALVVRQGLDPQPLIRGGGQEYGKRAGTQNLAAAMGFAAALQHFLQERDVWDLVLRRLKNLEMFLVDAGGSVIARDTFRLPNTCCVRMPGVLAETQIMALDLAGFAVSAGSACSSGKVQASHVLTAMGLSGHEAQETIRISLCPETTDKNIDDFSQAWQRLYSKTRTH